MLFDVTARLSIHRTQLGSPFQHNLCKATNLSTINNIRQVSTICLTGKSLIFLAVLVIRRVLHTLLSAKQIYRRAVCVLLRRLFIRVGFTVDTCAYSLDVPICGWYQSGFAVDTGMFVVCTLIWNWTVVLIHMIHCHPATHLLIYCTHSIIIMLILINIIS